MPTTRSFNVKRYGLRLVWAVVFSAIVAFRLWHDTKAYDPGDPVKGCGVGELDHSDQVETSIYQHLLPHLYTAGQTQVALLTLARPAVPLEFFQNVCEGRRLFTYLVPRIVKAKPRVLAIDKFYSEGACPNERINQAFRQAVNQASQKIPVVVSWAAEDPEPSPAQTSSDDCLTLIPTFNFDLPATSLSQAVPSRVMLGLTRLNENTLQIPLAWPVRRVDDAPPTLEPSFALTVAEQADPSLAGDPYIRQYAAEPVQKHHPFGVFPKKLPTWSVMDLLCDSADNVVHDQHLGSCNGRPETAVNIQGKVLVVGEHVSDDRQPFPGGLRYGMDLQGNYIDALMTRHFLKQMPTSWDWIQVGLVVAIPMLLEATSDKFRRPKKHLHTATQWSQVVLILVCTVLTWLVLFIVDAWLLVSWHIYAPIFVLSILPIGIGILFSFVPALMTDVKDVYRPR